MCTSLQKFKISAIYAEICRNLRFMQKSAESVHTFCNFCREVHTFCNFCREVHTFCRNLIFLQKVCTSLQKFKISAGYFLQSSAEGVPFCRNIRFLQRGAHFLQISVEMCTFLQKYKIYAESVHLSAEILAFCNFCREVHTFCRNLQKCTSL